MESTVNSLQLKKKNSEHLKIKWTNSRKEDRILIKNVSLIYKKRVSVPTQQYFNGSHMDVVTFDIYFSFYHKNEDIVKHHNHDPTLKHQQT